MVLPFMSASVVIGFNPPGFRVRCDASRPTTRFRLVPNKSGSYLFHCNIYGRVGHEIRTAAGNRASFCRIAAARPRGSGRVDTAVPGY